MIIVSFVVSVIVLSCSVMFFRFVVVFSVSVVVVFRLRFSSLMLMLIKSLGMNEKIFYVMKVFLIV